VCICFSLLCHIHWSNGFMQNVCESALNLPEMEEMKGVPVCVVRLASVCQTRNSYHYLFLDMKECVFVCVCVCACVCECMCVCICLWPIKGTVLTTLIFPDIPPVLCSQLRALPTTELAISQRVADGTEGVMHSQPASDRRREGTEVRWRWSILWLRRCCGKIKGMQVSILLTAHTVILYWVCNEQDWEICTH